MAYKYTGKELDDSTGLYFYEARYYDATLGRFISADTLVPNPGNPQDFNRYTYGNNNPIRFNDPTGRVGINFIKKAFKNATRKLKNTLGSPGFTVLSFAIQVGIVPVPLLSPIQSGILGTGLLPQSKSGRYVLAGEIIVGTAVASWECGACATAPVINGALAGELSLGATGGLSAARNGGDIRKGVLFGTATGAVVGGLSGGTLDKFGLLNPAGSVILPSFGTSGPFVAGTAISGALLGAGKGATDDNAGGRGNFASIIRGAAQSAITGSITSPFTTYVGTLLSWQFLGGGMPKTPYSKYSLTWNAPDGNGLGELAPLAITLPRGLTNSVGEAGLIVGISELRR